MASADGNTAADCGYPVLVLIGDAGDGALDVPASAAGLAHDGSYGAAAPGYTALISSLGAAAAPGYTALISSLGAAAAAANGPAPATDAATGQPAALNPYQPLGPLLGVRDFVHLASGRKVQLIACREPRVSCTVGVPAVHTPCGTYPWLGLGLHSWWRRAARQAGTGVRPLTALTLSSPILRQRRHPPLTSTCVPPLKQP